MKALHVFKITILFTFVVLLHPNTLKSQTYEEIDALYKTTVDKFSDENFDRFYTEAKNAFDAKEYDKAIDWCNQYIIYFPNSNNINLIRARAFEEKSEPLKAKLSYLNAIEIAPEHTYNYIHYAWLLLIQGASPEAYKYFQKAQSLSPDNYDALRGIAYSSLFAGEYQACIIATKELMKHEKFQLDQKVWAYVHLAQAYAFLEDKKNAKLHFEEAIALQADVKESLFYQLFINNGYSCKEYSGKKTNSEFAYYLANFRNWRCGNDFACENLSDIERKKADINFQLALWAATHQQIDTKYRINKQNDKSKNIFTDSINPQERADLLDEFTKNAKKYFDAGDYKRTVPWSRMIEQLEPDNKQALMWTALSLLRSEKKEDKIWAWGSQIDLSKLENAAFETRLVRGWFYIHTTQNWTQALKELDEATKLNSDNLLAKTGKGISLAKLGRTIEAYPYLEEAYLMNDEDPIIKPLFTAMVSNSSELTAKWNSKVSKIKTIQEELYALRKDYATHENKISNGLDSRKRDKPSRNDITELIKYIDENYSSFDIYVERYKVVLQKAKESKNEELTAVIEQEMNKIFKTRSDMKSLKNVLNKLYDTMNAANK